MVGQPDLVVGIEHLVDRMLGRRPLVGAADRLVGIELRHRPSQRRPVQRLPQVRSEVEVAEALRVALAAAQERCVVQPLQLVGIALVPAAVGQRLQQRGHDMAPQRRRQQGVVRGVEVAVVAVVAAEQLVAAIAADHHLDVLARHLREQVDADRKGIGRLVEMMDQLRQVGDQRRHHQLLVVPGAVPLRDRAGAGRFVELAQGEADGEGRDRLSGRVLHEEGDDQRGIEAAAEEAADRDVAHHVQPDALDQDRLELLDQLLLGALVLGLVGEIPVALDAQPALFAEGQEMRRRQLPDRAEHAARRRDHPDRQVLVQRLEVGLGEARGRSPAGP